jgi:hypothetical protein
VFGPLAYIIKARVEGLRDFGPCISPFNSFLFIQGIETLKFRMEAHCRNAMAVAEWLGRQPAISWVKYPGLKSSPYYDISQKYLPKGQGSVLTFGIKGGTAAGRKLIDNVKIFSHLANLGDAKSLIIHPASCAGISGHTPYRLSALRSADSPMPECNILANNPREVSPYKHFCGTVDIASESRVHAPTRGRPLIYSSAPHHIHRTMAMCGIPFGAPSSVLQLRNRRS